MLQPQKRIQLVFLITCTNSENISACLGSISKNNNSLNCLILLLLQNNIELSVDAYTTSYTSIKILHETHIIPLSRARNILLQSERIYSDSFYMFPDDDSIFDHYFFECFTKVIFNNTLIAVKGTQDQLKYFLKMPSRKVALMSDFDKAISVNMVIKGDTIQKIGGFDEELGVGNYYGAGEDNDYFLRCNAIEQFVFSNDLWNYHPLPHKNALQSLNNILSRYKSYGRGVIYMLLKHKMILEASKVVVKGYLGCIKNLGTLNWKMAYVYLIAANTRLNTFVKNIK